MQNALQKPPTFLIFRGFKIPVKTDFKTVLKIQEILQDGVLLPSEKIHFCCKKILYGPAIIPFWLKKGIFSQYIKQIINKNGTKSTGQRVIDFTQDADYIKSAFMQAYNLNIEKATLHWWSFLSLLGGLPEDTRLMQIVSIRARPIPKATKYNAEERAQVLRLKSQFAIKKSEEERQQDLQDGLKKMAMAMLARARPQKEVVNNG